MYNSCTKTLNDLLLHFSYIQEDPPTTSVYNFYMNNSSFLLNSHQVVGYTMISDDGITKAAFLPYILLTNLQAELVDFTRAFRVTKNTTLMVYRDSKYAFYIQLTHSDYLEEIRISKHKRQLNN